MDENGVTAQPDPSPAEAQVFKRGDKTGRTVRLTVYVTPRHNEVLREVTAQRRWTVTTAVEEAIEALGQRYGVLPHPAEMVDIKDILQGSEHY